MFITFNEYFFKLWNQTIMLFYICPKQNITWNKVTIKLGIKLLESRILKIDPNGG